MLLVKTKLGQSAISGIGLFADECIPKGTVIWKFQPGFDLKIDPTQVALLSATAKTQFEKYTYVSKYSGLHILCFDDARFYNHSPQPNSIHTPTPDDIEGIDVAGKDIQPGEEITCDYTDFDTTAEAKLQEMVILPPTT